MSDKQDGGPAFPFPVSDAMPTGGTRQPGMTLRDYFAAKALQGFLPNYHTERSQDGDEALAKLAYRMADAMIAARAK
jgi:hypothetical protein